MAALFTTACNNDIDLELPNVEDEEYEIIDPEVVDKDQVLPVAEMDEVVIEANGFLIDDTDIGFNYESAMVNDRDFSTAWCGESSLGGELSVSFASTVFADGFGYVPGFARDEEIFFDNNRLAQFYIDLLDENGEVVHSQMVKPEDEYGMQFVDFGDDYEFVKMNLSIEGVYDGDRYDDTCIAELDFWSDYVIERDADAALNYYETNKKDNALKPYDVVGSVTVFTGFFDEKEVSNVHYGPYRCTDSVYSPVGLEPFTGGPGDDMHVFAAVNQYGAAGGLLDVDYYHELVEFSANEDGFPDFNNRKVLGWEHISSGRNIEIIETCDGREYFYHMVPGSKFSHVFTPFASKYRVVVSTPDGKVIGSEEFTLAQ